MKITKDQCMWLSFVILILLVCPVYSFTHESSLFFFETASLLLNGTRDSERPEEMSEELLFSRAYEQTKGSYRSPLGHELHAAKLAHKWQPQFSEGFLKGKLAKKDLVAIILIGKQKEGWATETLKDLADNTKNIGHWARTALAQIGSRRALSILEALLLKPDQHRMQKQHIISLLKVYGDQASSEQLLRLSDAEEDDEEWMRLRKAAGMIQYRRQIPAGTRPRENVSSFLKRHGFLNRHGSVIKEMDEVDVLSNPAIRVTIMPSSLLSTDPNNANTNYQWLLHYHDGHCRHELTVSAQQNPKMVILPKNLKLNGELLLSLKSNKDAIPWAYVDRVNKPDIALPTEASAVFSSDRACPVQVLVENIHDLKSYSNIEIRGNQNSRISFYRLDVNGNDIGNVKLPHGTYYVFGVMANNKSELIGQFVVRKRCWAEDNKKVPQKSTIKLIRGKKGAPM